MTLEYPFTNFYDSNSDSQNESNILDDTDDFLNLAFIASPGKSTSCVYNDESLSDLSNPRYLRKDEKNWVSTSKRKLMPKFHDLETEIGNITLSEISKTTDLSKKNEEKLQCIFTSTCLDEFQKSSNEYDWRKFDEQFGREDESEKTEEITDLTKKIVEKPDCVFTPNCLDESQKSPKEYDWGKFDKMSRQDDESEKTEHKIGVSVPRLDHVFHELSTILEVDSVLMEESDESLMNSDKHGSLIMQDTKFSKGNDSFKIFNKPNSLSNFPANVMKVIQYKDIEKFLQEPGLLEELDLTLISTDLDTTCSISEKHIEQGCCQSIYKMKRFNGEESPSLISFLQHELNCMKECEEE